MPGYTDMPSFSVYTEMEKGPRIDIDAAVPFPFCIYDVSKAGDVFIYRPYHIAAVRHPVGTDIPRFRIYELWYPVEYVRTGQFNGSRFVYDDRGLRLSVEGPLVLVEFIR